MIVRTGAPASFEPSSPIPVRRFTFRVGEGQPEQLLDGPRLATLVKATSSLSVIDVDGVRIVLDGPIGGRPGKQLIVQAREEESGLKLEVRPRPAVRAESGSELQAVPSKESGKVPSEAPVAGQVPKEAPWPASPIRQPAGQSPAANPDLAPAPNAASRPANPRGDALTAIAISETFEGAARTTLLGVDGSPELPLRAGEALPVQAILARPERTVFSVRGVEVEAQAGGFESGKTYWAEVVSGAPNAVIRIQSSVDGAALQAISPPRLSFATDAGEVLLPGDIPSGTNLVARALSRLPGGELLLDVGGRQLAAPLPQGIQSGEEVLLRIEHDQQGAHQVRLVEQLRNLIQPPSNRLPLSDSLGLLSRQLKALLAQGEEAPALLRLAAKVEGMIGPDAPPSAQRIANLVERGGLQYESKLARILLENRPQRLGALLHTDLKALLLRAQSEIRLQTDLAEPWSRLAESVDRQLSHIEILQTSNLAAQSHSAPLQLEIPFLAGGHLSTVKLFIQPDGQEPDSDWGEEQAGKGFNILFLLDLQGLGRTRVDAHLSGVSLSALISVEQSGALERLQTLLPRLEKSLEQAGFASAHLGVRLLEKRRPETNEAPSLGAPGGAVPAKFSRIDVVA